MAGTSKVVTLSFIHNHRRLRFMTFTGGAKHDWETVRGGAAEA